MNNVVKTILFAAFFCCSWFAHGQSLMLKTLDSVVTVIDSSAINQRFFRYGTLQLLCPVDGVAEILVSPRQGNAVNYQKVRLKEGAALLDLVPLRRYMVRGTRIIINIRKDEKWIKRFIVYIVE